LKVHFDIPLSEFWSWDREGLMTQGVIPSREKRLFSKLTSKNNMSAKKIILLLIGHTKYTKHVRFYLPVPPSVTVFILTVSAFMLFTHTHTLLTFPTSVMPFHNISSSVPSTALDTQHLLTPLAVTPGQLHFQVVVIHTD
jgi:hypothetical protein